MRIVIFLAGFLLAALGFVVFRQTKDPSLLQGGLTLGGGFIICGIFSLKAKWHGIVGAGVLALLGTLRAAPNVTSEPRLFHITAAAICAIVLIGAVRTLLAERTRRSVEALKARDHQTPP